MQQNDWTRETTIYFFILETEARAIDEVTNLEQETPVAANQR